MPNFDHLLEGVTRTRRNPASKAFPSLVNFPPENLKNFGYVLNIFHAFFKRFFLNFKTFSKKYPNLRGLSVKFHADPR